jgi:hypothetical protein
MDTSPAALVLAIALLVIGFLAPDGLVGLMKRAAGHLVIIESELPGRGVEADVGRSAGSVSKGAAPVSPGEPPMMSDDAGQDPDDRQRSVPPAQATAAQSDGDGRRRT